MRVSTAKRSPVSAVAAPVEAIERIHALDILRGLALFGMILVHFHQRMRLEASGLEDLIGWGVYVLVEQKAWGTFAFLFGVGFAILLRRLEARGVPIASIYLRRLAALAAFGVVAEVFFGFTILFTYAAWGVALLVMRKCSTRTLLVAAALVACARPVAAEVMAIHAWLVPGTTASAVSMAAFAQAAEQASRQGSYPVLLAARWNLFVASLPYSWRSFLPDVNLALFTLGLLAVRHRVLDEPREHLRLIKGWMLFGAFSWAMSWVVLDRLPRTSIPGADWPLAYGLGLLQDQWLCFTYIGAVVLLLAFRPEWTQKLAMFGYAGRMALTNYMVQIIVLDALASGYGVGLKLRPAVYPLVAVALFGAEALASRWWLERFRFGPLEWLWRVVTYADPQPIRRQVPATLGVG
jgi:uncharacterized protein